MYLKKKKRGTFGSLLALEPESFSLADQLEPASPFDDL